MLCAAKREQSDLLIRSAPLPSPFSLPRAADGVHAELRRVAGPNGRRAEGAAECAVAWVVALELVVDSRDSRAGHAPAVVRLQHGRRRHDEHRRLAEFGVRVIAVPVVQPSALDGAHVVTIATGTAARCATGALATVAATAVVVLLMWAARRAVAIVVAAVGAAILGTLVLKPATCGRGGRRASGQADEHRRGGEQ